MLFANLLCQFLINIYIFHILFEHVKIIFEINNIEINKIKHFHVVLSEIKIYKVFCKVHIDYNYVIVVLRINSNKIFDFLDVVIHVDICLLQNLQIKFLEQLSEFFNQCIIITSLHDSTTCIKDMKSLLKCKVLKKAKVRALRFNKLSAIALQANVLNEKIVSKNLKIEIR